jgi:2-polyprenyl-3-methyl-5-hydroxy-6-metoxy-1,4-benzoquinol methylase
MPSSNLALAPVTLNHLWDLKPRSVLDIGPGHGKFSVLIREYIDPTIRMIAIEAIPDYVDQFGLDCLYDQIHVTDVMLAPDDALNSCDAVLMADVIEHLTMEDAEKLLLRIHRPVVISTPEHFFHNPQTYWSEVHRSHWKDADFQRVGKVVRHDKLLGGHVVTLAGRAGLV